MRDGKRLAERVGFFLQKRAEGSSFKESEVRQLVSIYDWAAALAPSDNKILSRRNYVQGMAASFRGDPSAALQFLQDSVKYDGTWAPAYNELGKTYVRLKDHDHAADSYRKAIDLDPKWVFPQINLGGVYLHDKQWDLAEQSYLSATRLDTTLATPWYFLGQVYEARREHSRAIDAYQQAIRLASTRPSSAFHVDAVQRRVEKLQTKALSSPLATTSPEAVPAAQSPAPPQYTVRLFNCDDGCRLLVNGEIVSTSGFGQDTGAADIGQWLHPGQNQLTMQVINETGAITYGFQIVRDNNSISRHDHLEITKENCRATPDGIVRLFSQPTTYA